ncbi:MAG: 1-deoxy-D-xylulose-5-phosphate reductoisomerase, partial [Pseudomonadota bacterium]|nr:1-deoxy-D-xylulose-5-phosphate reductoisomerase [Pseudomonadota bacterium]
FEEPDFRRFPALRLAREALEEGGSAPAVLNAANEVAVASFLDGRIQFPEIPRLVKRTLEQNRWAAPGSIEEVFEIDRDVRRLVSHAIEEHCA